MFFNKFSDRANHGKIADTYNDFWSGAVSSVLDSVGITPEIRDEVQPAIDAGKSLLPVGGITPATSGVAAKPQATGFTFATTMSPTLIIGAAILGVALLYVLSKE